MGLFKKKEEPTVIYAEYTKWISAIGCPKCKSVIWRDTKIEDLDAIEFCNDCGSPIKKNKLLYGSYKELVVYYSDGTDDTDEKDNVTNWSGSIGEFENEKPVKLISGAFICSHCGAPNTVENE